MTMNPKECVKDKRGIIEHVGNLPILRAGTSWDRATRRKYKLKKNLNCS